nr:hypothetical protein [Spiractinospora alimapuensis]
MRRLIYLAVGFALGGYAVHRLNRSARSWGPNGLAQRVEGRVADYRSGIRELGEDVADVMAERESDLRRRYGG